MNSNRNGIPEPADSLRALTEQAPFGTILADPPWQFSNRTGKVAPEHRRLRRYETMTLKDIAALPVKEIAASQSHLYLWVPNALLLEGMQVMEAWGFTYKTNLVWYKIRKDGGPDGRGVGFYFRNVTELVLFGVRGGLRTAGPGRRQVNLLTSRKREHSRKPDELYDIVERCSPGPFLELFARHACPNWVQWGDELQIPEENATDVEVSKQTTEAYRMSVIQPRLVSGRPSQYGATSIDTTHQNGHQHLR